MSDESEKFGYWRSGTPITHKGTFEIASFSETFPPDTYNHILFGIDPGAAPTYTLTITLHFYRVRRRLSRIMPLMRRPRGRKLLRVVPITDRITLYDVFLEQNQ